MQFATIFDQVMEEFGHDKDLACLVVVLHATHVRLQPEPEDFVEKGRYTKRLLNFWRESYSYRYDLELFELGIDIALALHDFSLGRDMFDFRTLKEILEERYGQTNT